MVIDFLAGFILYFLNDKFLFPFLIFGIFFLDRKVILKSISLMLFCIVVNAYLKQYWKIPLNPDLFKTGWAYPSGHTSANLVFWCSIAYHYKKPLLWACLLIIFTLSLFAMNYVGYHNWIDIFGGVCLGLIIAVSSILYMHLPLYIWASALHIISLLILFIMIPNAWEGYRWLWLSQGCLLSIAVYDYFNHKFDPNKNLAFFNFILAITLSILANKGFNIFPDTALITYFKGVIIVSTILFVTPILTEKFANIFKRI